MNGFGVINVESYLFGEYILFCFEDIGMKKIVVGGRILWFEGGEM